MRNFFYFFLRLFKGTAEYTMMRGIQNCIRWSQKCLEWKVILGWGKPGWNRNQLYVCVCVCVYVVPKVCLYVHVCTTCTHVHTYMCTHAYESYLGIIRVYILFHMHTGTRHIHLEASCNFDYKFVYLQLMVLNLLAPGLISSSYLLSTIYTPMEST